MPVYTYRRDDGTTFDYRQKFTDEALKVDPVTGQHVIRVVQPAGVIFKGSGFYVNDSKSASRSSVNNTASHNGSDEKSDKGEKSDKPAKSESSETKSSTESTPAPNPKAAAPSKAPAAAE